MPLLPTIWSLLKRHRKKAIAGAILLILLGLGVSRTLQPKQSEYVTAIAERGNLQQTVEAVGTVISERDLELRFAATGIVQQVFVREGDNVIAGQKLARLKGSSLSANIASLSAALLVAQADLRALEEGTRPEDIAIAEADFQNKRASLQSARQTLASAEMNITQSEQQMETLRREAAVNLSGQVSTSLSGLGEDFTMIENSLSTVDDVLARTDVDDALVKSNPAAKSDMQSQKRTALSAIAAARAPASDTAANYQQALSVLGVAKSAAEQSGRVLDSLFSLISSLPETQYMSASVRETIKASIATERSGVQTATSSIASAHSALQNASASYDTKIASQSASVVTLQGMRDKAKVEILTYEAAVRSGEAQLQLQRAGARRTDIDAARARVRQAQANLARSQADYADTILTAPVSGTVTHVHIRIGESTPTGAAVTLLGESPYLSLIHI